MIALPGQLFATPPRSRSALVPHQGPSRRKPSPATTSATSATRYGETLFIDAATLAPWSTTHPQELTADDIAAIAAPTTPGAASQGRQLRGSTRLLPYKAATLSCRQRLCARTGTLWALPRLKMMAYSLRREDGGAEPNPLYANGGWLDAVIRGNLAGLGYGQ